MKRLLFIFLLTPLSCLADEAISSDIELLHIRRIETLWQEKDLSFLKKHIKEFHEGYPHSSQSSKFSAMLGDIAFSEQKYEEALRHYESISDEKLQKLVQTKKWHSAYLLEKWHDLLFDITPPLLKQSDEAKYYYACASFHEGSKSWKEEKEAKSLLEEALSLYEQLETHPTFSENARLKIAEIHHLIGNPIQAKKYLLDLVNNIDPSHEGTLLQAAFLLRNYDPLKAKKISSHLTRFGLKTRKDAAAIWFYLLAKHRDLDEMLLHESTLTAALPPEKKKLCHFYLSKLHFERKNWEKCICNFEKSGFEGDLCHAFAYCQLGQTLESGIILENLLNKNPHDQMALCLKANLLAVEKKWDDALKISSSLPLASWIRIKSHLGKLAEDPHPVLYHDLIEILEKEDPAKYPLLLAQCYIASNENARAMEILMGMRDLESFEVEALLARLYFEKGEIQKGIYHGEKALSIHSNHELKSRLHLHLFNAYLKLAQEDTEAEFATIAAHHLYSVIDREPISLENRLWLAHHFVKQYERGFDPRDATKAIALLEPLCQDIQPFEREALDLASLYQHLGETVKGKALLVKVIEAQEKHPELKWKYKEKSKFLLAEVFQQSGELQKAVDLYFSLENALDKKIAYTASLQLARINFNSFKGTSNKEIDSIFQRLADLKAKRQLITEPVHLEAAIDLAEFRASFKDEMERDEELLSQLIEVKQEFSSEDDLSSKDYHLSLELMPEKGRLYSAYMRYLDAKICQLQSRVAKREGNYIESKTKERAAYALFSSLKQGKYAVTSYIKQKSESALR